MLRAAAGGALGLLGLGALGEAALAKKKGFEGDRCKKNKECGKGLQCKGDNNKNGKKGRCRYKDGCGKRKDACKKNSDCCGSRKCRHKTCKDNK
jgi:hypothetical protein